MSTPTKETCVDALERRIEEKIHRGEHRMDQMEYMDEQRGVEERMDEKFKGMEERMMKGVMVGIESAIQNYHVRDYYY